MNEEELKKRKKVFEKYIDIIQSSTCFNHKHHYLVWLDDYIKLEQKLNMIMEIIELNQYNYGYQIKEEILKGETHD